MGKLAQPLTQLKGVGPKTAEKFSAAGLQTLEDLITFYPRRYDSFDEPKQTIRDAADGQLLAVCGFIDGKLSVSYAGKFKITSGKIRAGQETIQVAWFNMPYLKNALTPGKKYVFRGYVKHRGQAVRLSQPAVYDPDAYLDLMKTLQPVYPLGKGLKEGMLRRAMERAFEEAAPFGDFLPQELLDDYDLMDEDNALLSIHFPEAQADMLRARKRLVFDEFLLFILAVRQLKNGRERELHDYELPSDELARQALLSLPYTLTTAQQRVWTCVEREMSSRKVMARLIQGDVGSGKTVIAFLALLKAADNRGQGALMVPTEVLAKQHYEAFTRFCRQAQLPVRAALLIGNMKAAQRRETLSQIASGEVQVIIGTHALISEGVSYHNLVLAVTDEQHRFGVRQREKLRVKGLDPHVLVMSATPIPRTLAVILYGDLDVSVIDEMPAGRKPVKNCVIDPSGRAAAYAFIRRETAAGHQAYVICPMVEESDELELTNVTDYAKALGRVMPPDITVEYLHGKMPPPEKNAVMERFVSGEIKVLVSTTVVEVGVNVPSATVMMVEDAQRFGLAQLHQLRGRVGRGDAQSYCILVNTAPDGEARKRLEIMNSSNDGFEIARKDLELRGPGDLFGIRQSGLIDFRIGDVFSDANILQLASGAAQRIIGEDVGLSAEKYDGLRKKLQYYMKESEASINI